MAKKFDLLIFDWDGTLMDSTSAIVAAIQAASRDLGLPEPTADKARHVIGLGLSDALHHAVPDLSPERYPQMAERYRYHYLAGDRQLDLFDGVAELLSELASAGYFLAVATGKSRLGLDRALDHSGLRTFFHATRTADECFSKPHPQMLEELLSEFGVDKHKALMVGDTTHDLQMARNAEVAGLGVTYGAHPEEVLLALEPLACVREVRELATWLRMNG